MNGPIAAYQRQFAQWCHAGHAYAFWKGRVALYALLRALGVGPGDEVILPGYTCVMDVNPIKYVGAVPVYVDIEPRTFNLDAGRLADKITDRTKVIIAQHTYGYPCDMDALMGVARSAGTAVIEDCCLSLGSTYKGRAVGTMGLAAYFSSQWNKSYTTGLGGMAVTSDAGLAERIEALRREELCPPSAGEVFLLRAQLAVYGLVVYPRTTALVQSVFRYLTRKGAVVGSSSAREYEPVKAADFFKGLSAVQARVGLKQLARIQRNLSHRRRMAALYDELLGARGWRTRAHDRDTTDPVMVRYPVRIMEKDRALAEAARAGIELGSWFECPLHPAETPLASYDYRRGMCPEAEKAAREVVNLPVHPRVTERTVAKTVEFITRFPPATT